MLALTAATSARAVEFPNPSVNCYLDWSVILEEGRRAVSQLGLTCDSGTPVLQGSKIYSSYGGVMAFICNWGGGSQACTYQEMNEAICLINEKCGEDVAGWVQINDWAKQYGRTTTLDNPCPNLNG